MNIKTKQFNSIYPGSPNSITVNNDLNYALRKWKKNLKDGNIIEDLFERKFYEKPSVTKRKQQKLAEYNQRKEIL
jgi:ribosomal protein S21